MKTNEFAIKRKKVAESVKPVEQPKVVKPEDLTMPEFVFESADRQYQRTLSEQQVDMKGKKCTTCKKGTYQETDIQDDMHGELHCTKCNTVIKSRQPAASKKKNVSEGGRLDMSTPEEKAARKAYIKAHGHPPPLTPDTVVAKYNPENDKKMRDYYLRRKGIPQDKLDKMKEDGVAEGMLTHKDFEKPDDVDVQKMAKLAARGLLTYVAKTKMNPANLLKKDYYALAAMLEKTNPQLYAAIDDQLSDNDYNWLYFKAAALAANAAAKPGVAEAGPGDINRLEHRGEEYNVYFNQRKGMYTARGTGQMKGQIQFEWFHTLADAIDHAEMEIGGYDEHDGVAEGLKEDATGGSTGSSSVSAVVTELGAGGMTKQQLRKRQADYTNVRKTGGPVKVKRNG